MTDNKSPNSADRYDPENLAYSAEDEIDLIELIRPLWQQKMLIAAITILTIAAAVVLVLRATPQYKIYTQVKPGTYRWDGEGNPIPYMKSADLKNLLTGGIFDTYAAKSELGHNTPKINASSSRQGDQLTAYFFWPNQAEGKKIMADFIDFLNDFDRDTNQNKRSGLQVQRRLLETSIKKIGEAINATNIEKQKVELNIDQKKEELKLVDLQKDRLKREIERVNADFKMTEKQVKFLEERITVAEETRADYEKSRRQIDENTTRIISLRDKLLQTPPDDSLQLLLLASTIQQNIAYLNTIGQKIETARKEVISHYTAKAGLIKKQEKYHLAIADLHDKINLEIPKNKSDLQKVITKLQWNVEKELPSEITLLNQQIEELHDKIDVISMVEVVNCPQASTKPLKPNKKKTVALAGVMGFFLAIIFAYLRHFWLINRKKLRSE
jgi:capsular polysaccharide biosynthesis protein